MCGELVCGHCSPHRVRLAEDVKDKDKDKDGDKDKEPPAYGSGDAGEGGGGVSSHRWHGHSGGSRRSRHARYVWYDTYIGLWLLLFLLRFVAPLNFGSFIACFWLKGGGRRAWEASAHLRVRRRGVRVHGERRTRYQSPPRQL